MAITYTWELKTFKKQATAGDLQNVIFQTHWTKTGTDENGLQGSFQGATPFDPAAVDPGTFIPYDQLTQEIVLGWIQAVVVGSYADHVNEKIQEQIDAQKVSSVEVGSSEFPWVTTSTNTSTNVVV
jgi:hypothetical protein